MKISNIPKKNTKRAGTPRCNEPGLLPILNKYTQTAIQLFWPDELFTHFDYPPKSIFRVRCNQKEFNYTQKVCESL